MEARRATRADKKKHAMEMRKKIMNDIDSRVIHGKKLLEGVVEEAGPGKTNIKNLRRTKYFTKIEF
jgi:hypothetical protein